MREAKLYLDGDFREGAERREVRSPYTGELVGLAHLSGAEHMERALSAGKSAERAMAALPAHERKRALRRIAAGLEARAEELSALVCDEAGKPITAAKAEIARALTTFELAAEECTRPGERSVPLDGAPAGTGRFGIVRRFPRGLVSAITPFNFPLNLVAHKVAPALAAGCPVVLKPAPNTPFSAHALAEIVHDAGLPPAALQVLPADPTVADVLVTDERPRVLTFTGSARVGWDLKARAGRKHVVLELGGDASVLVHADADLDEAARRIATGAFVYAGQVCISVQHVLVHESVLPHFRDRLLEATLALTSGDPRDPRVTNGPLIDERAASRVLSWIEEARAKGATLLCGGTREGNVIAPTVLEGVPPDAALAREEAFGPVCTLSSYATLDEALARVNASDYGLQAGVFTNDLAVLWRCYEALEVGGLIHNDVPTFRVDHMPYGGVKASGLGREGPAYALEDFTEARLLAFFPGPLR